MPATLTTEHINVFPKYPDGLRIGDAGLGVGVQTIPLYMTLASIATGDLLTDFTPGYAFRLVKTEFIVKTAATTAAKLATLNVEIGATNVTGGVIALTSANCTPAGVKVAGTAITALNEGTATDTLSVEASAVTAFVEGDGYLVLTLQNVDSASSGVL